MRDLPWREYVWTQKISIAEAIEIRSREDFVRLNEECFYYLWRPAS
jgi:hypothetical protein